MTYPDYTVTEHDLRSEQKEENLNELKSTLPRYVGL